MLSDPQTLFFLALAVVTLGLAIWVALLERRLGRLLRGKNAATLEEVIHLLHHRVAGTDETNEQIKKHLLAIEKRLGRSIQHVKTVRFNPFRDQGQGSNQSFATAFLDEHGDGVVISSLYTRDGVSVYAKPVNTRQSEFELTEEEARVLQS